MPDRSSIPSPPEELFAAWLARSGTEAEFEALCREHGEHAPALRKLEEEWRHVCSALRRVGLGLSREQGHSFALRLKEQYGSGVDPAIALERADEREPASASSQLVKRLAEHTLKGSRYQLRGELARGGMGAILRVWDEDLRRSLAMKVILGKGEPTSEGTPPVDRRLLARFLEEAQITGQLDHPGIVPVHDLGLDSEGRVYFTMKLVKGRDLRAIFELVFAEQEGWNETRALGVLLKVCEALAFAHAKGVIHRDLKPANVMVGGFGEVYVMDWGLARVLGREDKHDLRLRAEETLSSVKTERRAEREEAPDSPLFTMDGDVVGTPAYMPPEQALGAVERLSPRSDVYAIGAMLYHLLARHMPYVPAGGRMTNRMVLLAVTQGPPAPLATLRRDAPAELVAIVERAMAREPERRYRDTLELAEDLRAFLEHRVVAAYETGAWAETKKWVQRNKALAASLVLAAGAVTLGLATSLLLKAEADRNFEIAERQRKQTREALTRSEGFRLTLESSSSLYTDPGLALLLAVEAGKRQRTSQVHNALLNALDSCRERRVFRSSVPLLYADWSPSGAEVVTIAADGVAVIWSAATGEILRTLGTGGAFSTDYADTHRIADMHEVLRTEFSIDSSFAPRDLANIARAEFNKASTNIVVVWGEATTLWDLRTGDALLRTAGSLGRFSPDGRWLLTESGIWDVPSRNQRIAFPQKALSGTFSGNGQVLVVICEKIHVWGTTLWKELNSYEAKGASSTWPTEDGALIVAHSDAGGIEILHSGTGLILRPMVSKDEEIVRAVSPSTEQFISVPILAGVGGPLMGESSTPEALFVRPKIQPPGSLECRLHETRSGKVLASLVGHEKDVHSVAYSNDGRWIVTSSEDGTARIWDSTNGGERAVLRGHSGTVTTAKFSSDGTMVLTAALDGTARIWNGIGNETLPILAGFAVPAIVRRSFTTPEFSYDGRFVLTVQASRSVHVWETETGKHVRAVPEALFGRFSPSGEVVAFLGSVGPTPWNTLCSKACTWGLQDLTGDSDGRDLPWLGGLNTIFAVDYSEDEELVLVGSLLMGGRYNVRTFDIRTGEEVGRIEFGKSNGWSPEAQFTYEGHIATSDGNTLQFWDALGEPVQLKPLPFDKVSAVEFGPTGDQVAITGEGKLVLWDLSEWRPVGTVLGRTATYSADGSKVATISYAWAPSFSSEGDNSVWVWDAASGVELLHLTDHDDVVTSAAFSPDGRLLLTSSLDRTVRLSDADSGKLYAAFLGHEMGVLSAQFSPDGGWVLTDSEDGTCRLFPVDPYALAVGRQPRDFTEEERERYLLNLGDESGETIGD